MSMIKDKLEPEKIWNISSILLYNDEAQEIVRRDYTDQQLEISTGLISNLIQTLDNFAKNQFDEQVHEIHIGEYRLLFDQLHGYILVAITKPGDSVDTGKNSPMSRAVRTLLQRLGDELHLEENDQFYIQNRNLDFLDAIVDTINLSSDNPDSVFHNIQNFESTSKYFVTSVIITDDVGRPYVSRTYEQGIYTEDPMLLSSLLAAVNSFVAQITSLPFKEIVLGKYRLYLETRSNRIYMTTIELENENVMLNHNSEVHKKINRLNDNIIQSTQFLEENQDVAHRISVNHHTLTAVVDAIVIKSLQNTLGYKQIDRSQIEEVDVFDQKQSQTRTSNKQKSITSKKEYEKAQGIFSRIRRFFQGG